MLRQGLASLLRPTIAASTILFQPKAWGYVNLTGRVRCHFIDLSHFVDLRVVFLAFV